MILLRKIQFYLLKKIFCFFCVAHQITKSLKVHFSSSFVNTIPILFLLRNIPNKELQQIFQKRSFPASDILKLLESVAAKQNLFSFSLKWAGFAEVLSASSQFYFCLFFVFAFSINFYFLLLLSKFPIELFRQWRVIRREEEGVSEVCLISI